MTSYMTIRYRQSDLAHRHQICGFYLTATYHIYQTDAVLYEWADRMQMYNYDNRYLNVLLTVGVRL